jgi:hypothetical protein
MDSILYPLLGHIALVFALYAWLTVERALAVRRGDVDYSAYEFGKGEPPAAARVSRNLANQFELPIIFYVAVILLIQMDAVDRWDIAAAWVFLCGRIIHTGVQTLTSNVRMRGMVFMVNFLGVSYLVGHLALVI